MIDSFIINSANFTYETFDLGDNIKIQYPSDWSNQVVHATPVGHNNKTHLYGILFASPIKGPYLISRTFRMVIDYNSVYGEITPYAISIAQSWDNSTWTKTIEELSLNHQQSRILNTTQYHDAFLSEGQGYFPFNVDLESLNLPDQFYVYFTLSDEYLFNGLDCHLSDHTDFVSIPPTSYSLSLSPDSYKDLRSGDERDIQVKIQSFVTLPFRVSLSTERIEGLNLNFTPNNVYGVPMV
jgi:hypothetical protein